MAAAKGNRYAAKDKRWLQAINEALALKSRVDGLNQLRAIAAKLLAMAADGDLGAIKELGDRMDGKATQQIDAQVQGDLVVEIIRFADVEKKNDKCK